jgi:hypothetical protein
MTVKNDKENTIISHVRGHLAFIRVGWEKSSTTWLSQNNAKELLWAKNSSDAKFGRLDNI